MKHHYFNSIHETQLPEPIKESFEDEYEMAHLRRIKDTVYLILNYPAETTHRKTICVYSDTDNLYLYAPYDLEPYVENHSDLPDILMGMVSYYEILTRQIHKQVQYYEKTMEDLVDKSHISALYLLQKEMIIVQNEINSIERILNTIQSNKSPGLYREKDVTDYASILIETHQVSSNIQLYRLMLESLQQSSESLFSNKLNETMKRLTSITLIFSVPIFITGFFGMNVDIPYQEHPLILFFILVSSIIVTWLMTLYFHRKDLL